MADFLGGVRAGKSYLLSGARVTAVADAVNSVRNARAMRGTSGTSGVRWHGVTIRWCTLDGPVSAGSPVGLDAIAADYDTDPGVFRASPSTHASPGSRIWGLATQRIDEAGAVLVSGVAIVRVTKRTGFDRMVDINWREGGGAGDHGGGDGKLYTSAAGCGVILDDTSEWEDGEEYWTLVHILGYRTTEPPTWAQLETALRGSASTTNRTAMATPQSRYFSEATGAWGWQTSGAGLIQVAGPEIPAGFQIPALSYVHVSVDALSGQWFVDDVIGCFVSAEE